MMKAYIDGVRDPETTFPIPERYGEVSLRIKYIYNEFRDYCVRKRIFKTVNEWAQEEGYTKTALGKWVFSNGHTHLIKCYFATAVFLALTILLTTLATLWYSYKLLRFLLCSKAKSAEENEKKA